jgi:hypothetical protein
MKLKLLKPHTHAGVEYQPGDVIEMQDEGTADWLIDQGVGEDVDDESDSE